MSDEVTKGMDLGKIRMAWRAYAFGDERSNWYMYIPIEQGGGDYTLEGRGVCFAFVRYWLKLLNSGVRTDDVVMDIRGHWKHIIDTQKTIKFSQGWASTKLNQMEGMGLDIQTRHFPGATGGNLAKGSQGILDAIFGSGVGFGPEMSNTLRLFCLSVGGEGTAGHAIGFAVSSSALYFLDPNVGQFWCEGADEGVRTNFRNWFKNVFWPGTGYKESYHKGERVLVEFLPEDESVNGAIEPRTRSKCTVM